MSTSRFRGFLLAATCFWVLVMGGTISTQAQTRAYVANISNTISVLDTETNALVDTITVCTDSSCSPLIPAVTPDGARLYVTNTDQNTVSVVDTLTNTVIDTITVGQSPWGIAITPDGKHAYVANRSGTISVIDTRTNKVTATIPDSDNPMGVAITPDGTRAYVSNAIHGTVSVVDTSTNAIIANILVLSRFQFPVNNLTAIVITPDGTRAYVVSASTGQTYVINTMFNVVVKTIPTDLDSVLGGGNLSIAMSPDGTRVYTDSPGLPALIIDTFTNEIIGTIPDGGPPPFVGVTPDGTKLYIDAEKAVSIFDIATRTLITKLVLDRGMGGVAFGTLPEVPHSKEDCKDSGFQRFTALAFRNQGECVKFVNEHAKVK